MNIVIEGLDNSGKSRLAQFLHERLKWPMVNSKGPPKDPMGRATDQLSRDGVIFDRHVCISQPIYGKLRGDPQLPKDVIMRFYMQRPILIYCQGPRNLENHIIKSHDTPAHLTAVENNFELLRQDYLEWAISRAHLFYRWSHDDPERILRFIKGGVIHNAI